MATAYFRFYAELNDFLPSTWHQVEFKHTFERRASVKDMVESFGVPHPEIEIILVNGQSVDFSYIVHDQDHISLYPVFERLDVSPLVRLRKRPLRKPHFVVDTNLGRLARYLRLLGFDCLYKNTFSDDEVARISQQQTRIILTRDRRLLQRKIISHGLFVRATDPRQQVCEIMQRLDLYSLSRPFSRCVRCNGLLNGVDKAAISSQLPPKTRRYYDDFLQCSQCGQLYWCGAHHRRSRQLVEYFLEKPVI